MANMVCTIKESNWKPGIAKISVAWTSDDAAGTASGSTINKYTGEIIRLITVPGLAGLAPTDNYDLVVNDSDSVDALIGAGANRDTLNTEQVIASSLGAVFDSVLTFSISNAGNAKAGSIHLYIRKYPLL
jgi:hypothetical protein